eukprot:TRINITY_DN1174_c0_g3_i3.p1 TRINITY_DN1174_c0_g3~~TRINITY_DN1174_c0_g3_i3.p1  ORF type:complete len:1625 (+),score=387.81 TRINITY_DN1174_c0_g3_i3:170-5044(+)
MKTSMAGGEASSGGPRGTIADNKPIPRRMSMNREQPMFFGSEKRSSQIGNAIPGQTANLQRRGSLMRPTQAALRRPAGGKRGSEGDTRREDGEAGAGSNATMLKDRLHAASQSSKLVTEHRNSVTRGVRNSLLSLTMSLMPDDAGDHGRKTLAGEGGRAGDPTPLHLQMQNLHIQMQQMHATQSLQSAAESDEEDEAVAKNMRSKADVKTKLEQTRRDIKRICSRLHIKHESLGCGLPAIEGASNSSHAPPSASNTEPSPALNGSQEIKRVISRDSPLVRTLRRVRVFDSCSGAFLSMLAAGGEQMVLKTGEVRDFRIHSPASAFIVQSGSCRVEMRRRLVDDCVQGVCFGLAGVFAELAFNANAAVLPDVAVRGLSPREPCRLLVLRTPVLKENLTSFPEDHARLRGILRMISHPQFDASQQLLSAIQCSEAAKAFVLRATTRHIYMPGEFVCQEGRKTPGGLILILSGAISLEIGGVEVRRVSEGQVLGEGLLLGVSNQWATTARCVQQCDVMILHRQVFSSLLRELRGKQDEAATEEQREVTRLLYLLEGDWRKERVILSWPLFRGFDADFLANLARHSETRVTLPGNKVWEAGASAHRGGEVALHSLLHGTCEEATGPERGAPASSTTEERRRTRRTLVAGATIGIREFLGVREHHLTVVTARTLALVSLLHRGVFLDAVDRCSRELQSAEVRRLLKEELDRTEPLSLDASGGGSQPKSPTGAAQVQAHSHASRGSLDTRRGDPVLLKLSLFRGCDTRLVDALCHIAKHRFCIAGQRLCIGGHRSSSMFVMVRGSIHCTLDDVPIGRLKRGSTFNTLALSTDSFRPSYTCVCETSCELWALRRSDFLQTLDSFTVEKRRFVMLLSDPVQSLFIASLRNRRDSERALSSAPGSAVEEADASRKEKEGNHGPALGDLEIFEDLSIPFLQWAQEHLEPRIYFQDDVIFREGDEDNCLYLVCQGMVILEGTATQQGQVSLGPGTAFGEQCFLQLAEACQATALAIEMSLVQVMHRSVLEKGLQLFPDAVATLDRVAAKWTNAVTPAPQAMAALLQQVPLFSGCDLFFCRRIARSVQTRLFRKGEELEEPFGSAPQEWLYVLKSGSATLIELSTTSRLGIEERALREFEPVGAKQVLGLSTDPAPQVRMEKASVFYQLKASIITINLSRNPEEAARVCRNCFGVARLWPTDSEAVPLLSGTGTAFFERLISASDWRLVLPKSMIVTQGESGTSMFIMCHGAATPLRDGVAVGAALGPGDCIGSENFFRAWEKYRVSVCAVGLCHVRALAAAALDAALAECPAEAERFAQLRRTVAGETEELERVQLQRVAKAKLNRRVNDAFSRHVEGLRHRRRREEERRRKQSGVVPPEQRAAMSSKFLQKKKKSTMSGSSFGIIPSLDRRLLDVAEDNESTSSSNTTGHVKLPKNLWLLKPSGKKRNGRRFSTNSDGETDSSLGSSSDSSEEEKEEAGVQIDRAIAEYTMSRREVVLRSKVLRAVRSGVDLGAKSVTDTLMEEDFDELDELDCILPPYEGVDAGAGASTDGRAEISDRDERSLARRFQGLLRSSGAALRRRAAPGRPPGPAPVHQRPGIASGRIVAATRTRTPHDEEVSESGQGSESEEEEDL